MPRHKTITSMSAAQKRAVSKMSKRKEKPEVIRNLVREMLNTGKDTDVDHYLNCDNFMEEIFPILKVLHSMNVSDRRMTSDILIEKINSIFENNLHYEYSEDATYMTDDGDSDPWDPYEEYEEYEVHQHRSAINDY